MILEIYVWNPSLITPDEKQYIESCVAEFEDVHGDEQIFRLAGSLGRKALSEAVNEHIRGLHGLYLEEEAMILGARY
jgi:hypothetical protein